jgi:hypothetical protein
MIWPKVSIRPMERMERNMCNVRWSNTCKYGMWRH